MRARRTDGNHKTVLEALRRLGYPHRSLHTVGGGVEDILVGVHRVEERWTAAGAAAGPYRVDVYGWVLLELKVPRNRRQAPVPSDFTERQLDWYAQTKLYPRVVATGAADAIRQLRLLAEAPGAPMPLEPCPERCAGCGRAWDRATDIVCACLVEEGGGEA